MKPKLSALALGSLLLCSTYVQAGSGFPIRKLTKKQKAEIRKDMRSQMGWEFQLNQRGNPRLKSYFFGTGDGEVAATGQLIAARRGGRGVQHQQAGIVEFSRDGEWKWIADDTSRSPSSEFKTFEDPVESVRARESLSPIYPAVVVGRSAGKAHVLYSDPDAGSVMHIVTIDTDTGRPIAKSKNLARPAIAAAVQAWRSQWQGKPYYANVGALAEDGRSVEVHVRGRRRGWYSPTLSTYKVDLDSTGLPTGTPVEVSQKPIFR